MRLICCGYFEFGFLSGLGMWGWDRTVEARRVAGLFRGGNKLWEIGMVGIIGTDVKTVKERRRQGSCFYAPIPYGWILMIEHGSSYISDIRRIRLSSLLYHARHEDVYCNHPQIKTKG